MVSIKYCSGWENFLVESSSQLPQFRHNCGTEQLSKREFRVPCSVENHVYVPTQVCGNILPNTWQDRLKERKSAERSPRSRGVSRSDGGYRAVSGCFIVLSLKNFAIIIKNYN